jgi:hypothetical protein
VRLARTIRACHGLQELALSVHEEEVHESRLLFNSAVLSSCIAALPDLRSLRLDSVKLTSLSFLSNGALPRSLTQLSLLSLEPRLLPVELMPIFGLQALQHLTLLHVLAVPLPGGMARQLRPPSEELPALVDSNIDDAFQTEDRLEERARIGMPLMEEEEYEDQDGDAGAP